jgi:DNA-binding CsgD family transcriptional regulator
MITIDGFSRMVSTIYGAAITPEHWAAAMAEIRGALDAQGAAMMVTDGPGRMIQSASVQPEAGMAYSQHYWQLDYVMEAVETGPVGLVRGGRSLVALNPRSEFDADWMRPHQMDDGMFVRLSEGPTPTSFLVAAAKRDEPFDTADNVGLMNALVPHLQQALRTQNCLREAAIGAGDVSLAIDFVRYGVAVISANSTVVHMNSAASCIFRSNDGLSVRAGGIEAVRSSSKTRLEISIGAALHGRQSGVCRGDSFLCSRPSGKRPYVVHVMPAGTTLDREVPRALVVIIDPELQPEPSTDLLRRLYGFTQAEAEVAVRVLRGDGLKPIADELSVSLATVKTHLQHVFDKTDTHRQAELVRLLLTVTH